MPSALPLHWDMCQYILIIFFHIPTLAISLGNDHKYTNVGMHFVEEL